MRARIYKPTKSAMQSGDNKSKIWKLEFEPSCTQYIEPLMKWTGSHDTRQQIRLFFKTKELAIAYAIAHNIDYIVLQNNSRTTSPKSYASNFTRLRGI
ncbi:NADH-ubiquinone oxidoreductase [Ehrlichia minasensis]|uniref:NADH-ubiquinone oxidoreductase n=1 Tax=Ehrlichia minasensis TaxID=1242993 RepID=A0A4V2BQQ4_9RICK|nr:ETC complex I subunit [Ehrlichia minasensis]RZB12794.1 NADH-ubiquinone oxidoreductase [Ehrlichia minasensis]CEI84948.1 ETC complex I subunit conserved region [Ehrlichia minasensis]